jgi:hypothetical protein
MKPLNLNLTLSLNPLQFSGEIRSKITIKSKKPISPK